MKFILSDLVYVTCCKVNLLLCLFVLSTASFNDDKTKTSGESEDEGKTVSSKLFLFIMLSVLCD